MNGTSWIHLFVFRMFCLGMDADISSLSKGLYIPRITMDEKVFMKEMILK